MPDRIVRAGIIASDPVNNLSWAGEVFYRRLLNIVDDFGRYDARYTLLRAHLYPLKLDQVSDADVGKWITECVTAGLVSVYQVSGRPYVEVLKFGQRVRAEKSKWPAPSGGQSPTTADNRCQPPTIAAVDVDVDVVGGERARARESTPGFARFWGEWPAHPRKHSKDKCLSRWRSLDLEGQAERIVQHVRAMKASLDWRKSSGEYIPAPLTYLNQQRYDTPTANPEPRRVAL